jgi:hypothetical protein
VVEALFETDEERDARRKRNILFFFSTLVIFIAVIGLYNIYEVVKPLPNVDACRALNYSAGLTDAHNRTVCFNDCRTKNVFECKVMKAITR